MAKLNILIVCEHASNLFGGEAMLPLNYFRYLSKLEHNVYLITHERVQTTIEQLADINQEHVFYLPDTWAHKLLCKYAAILPERISILTFGFLMHIITQAYQWKLARRLVKALKIDIVHEPAPVSAVLPSAMFALSAPVVIGPMNGGMTFPSAFQHMAGQSERLLYKVMRLFTSIYNLMIPGKFFADILLVANERTRNVLPKLTLGKTIELVENGVFSALDKPKSIQNNDLNKNINVLYVGRLVDWKVIDIAIDAIAQCGQNITLTILGDGDQRHMLEQSAASVAPARVHFKGLVPHVETNKYYDEADIFLLPSVRECGGAVVLEAMARGLPVIATDWGGPADYITPETGFLVEPKSRAYMVDEFARIIELLANKPELRYQIGQAAIARIKQYFLWDKKTEQIIAIYKQAMERRVGKNG
jgi:glycosyltransferase involved in cell wall biosynthesis